MSKTKLHRRKILRTSWKAKGYIILLLLGVAVLYWWRIVFVGDVLVTSVLVTPLLIFFGWILIQYLKIQIILDAEEIVYQNGTHRKKAKYTDIDELWFRQVGAFDAANTQWIFLLLSGQTENRDEESFNNFSQWLGVKEPEKTMTLDMSHFDLKTVIVLLQVLSESAPQAKYDPESAALITGERN